MNKELIEIFEGQEVKVVTDKGVTMYNLSNTARCCGLVKVENGGKPKIRWSNVKKKLNTICSSCDEYGKLEIEETLYKIENDIENRKNIYISTRLTLDLANICRNEKAIKFYNFLLQQKYDISYKKVSVARKEISFLDKLEQVLLPFGIKGKRQYIVKNKKGTKYRIDYYIKSMNIAIEYDENGHSGYSYEKHEGRQKEIGYKLGCRFIRISDDKSDEYNIGVVIKELFNI